MTVNPDTIATVYWPLEPALSPLALQALASCIGLARSEWEGTRYALPESVDCELHNLQNEILNTLQHREADLRMAAREEEIDELLR